MTTHGCSVISIYVHLFRMYQNTRNMLTLRAMQRWMELISYLWLWWNNRDWIYLPTDNYYRTGPNIWNNYFYTLDSREYSENKWGYSYDHSDFLPEGTFHTTQQTRDHIQNRVDLWIEGTKIREAECARTYRIGFREDRANQQKNSRILLNKNSLQKLKQHQHANKWKMRDYFTSRPILKKY